MKYVYLFAVLTLVFGFFAAYLHDKHQDEFSQACDARGGRALFLKDGYYCVDKSVFR